MSYEVLVIPSFKKELKRLCKKYHLLRADFATLPEGLKENPAQGV